MSIYKQKVKTQKEVKHTVYKSVKHVLAAIMFCMVLCIGTVCMAYPETPGTVVVESAKIRSSADTSGSVLASVKKNQTVSICDEVTGSDGNVWYQVFVDANTKGYIRSDLVQKSGSTTTDTSTATTTTTSQTTTTTSSTELPETQVTATEQRTGTVVTNNVRIRKGASTAYGVVATANKGMVLTVTGEAAGGDGKTWYQVSFTYNSKEITGFIRSDLVTFDSVPADTAVSEITGTESNGETATETETEEQPATEEPATQEEPQQETETSNDDTKNIILMNVDEEIYVMPGFEQIILKWEDQDINAYKNGDFYIFYAQKQNGEQGWYVFDSTNGTYQRYAYAVAGVTVPEENAFSGSVLPVIILVVIIIALLIAVGIMFVKLREYTGEVYDDDYSEDEEEDEEAYAEEEDEESEVEEVEVREPRRTERPQRPVRPQRRPQEFYENEDMMEERPNRPNPNNRPNNAGNQQRPIRPNQNPNARRPEGSQPTRPSQNPNAGRRPEGNQQPQRRVDEEGRPVRPNGSRPQQRPNGQPTGNRRPTQQQNRPVRNQQPPKGYKAKNFLEADEDDDMEFIDI